MKVDGYTTVGKSEPEDKGSERDSDVSGAGTGPDREPESGPSGAGTGDDSSGGEGKAQQLIRVKNTVYNDTR